MAVNSDRFKEYPMFYSDGTPVRPENRTAYIQADFCAAVHRAGCAHDEEEYDEAANWGDMAVEAADNYCWYEALEYLKKAEAVANLHAWRETRQWWENLLRETDAAVCLEGE